MPTPLSGCLGERLDTQRKWHSERATTSVAAPDDRRIERQVLPHAGRSGHRNRRCLAPRHIDRTIKAVVPASVVVAMIFPSVTSPVPTSTPPSPECSRSVVIANGSAYRPTGPRKSQAQRSPQRRYEPYSARCDLSAQVRSTSPPWRAYVVEAILTTLLIIVILNTAHEHSIIGSGAAIRSAPHSSRAP